MFPRGSLGLFVNPSFINICIVHPIGSIFLLFRESFYPSFIALFENMCFKRLCQALFAKSGDGDRILRLQLEVPFTGIGCSGVELCTAAQGYNRD